MEAQLPSLITNQLSSVVVGAIAFYFFWKVSVKFSDTVTSISSSYAENSNLLAKRLQELSDSNRELTKSNEELVRSNENFLQSNSVIYERLRNLTKGKDTKKTTARV